MPKHNHYGAIYCDPPWSFKTYSGAGTPHRTEQDHYQVMVQYDLSTIPVGEWAAKDCALFMWVIDSHLPQALELIKAWGFEYKTIAFNWVKLTKGGEPRVGMGYWTRKQSEICLMATKGKPKRISKAVRQVIMEQRREHSRKPDDIRRRIEALVAGPYLEMFARQSTDGWDAWGNETEKFTSSESDAP